MQQNKLFNRNFSILLFGQSTSIIGDSIYILAIMWWLQQVTGSTLVIGTVMLFSLLPRVLLSPFTGTLADRLSRKTIMIITDLTRGGVVLGIALLELTGNLIPEILFLSALLEGIATAFFLPSYQASIPDLVPRERLVQANSFNRSAKALMDTISPALGGLIYSLLRAGNLFLINSFTFIVAGISTFFIKFPTINKPPQSAGSFFQGMKEGFTVVRKTAGTKEILITAAMMNLFLSSIIVILPSYIDTVLMASSTLLGFVMGGLGAGALIGLLLSGTIKLPHEKRPYLVVMYIVTSAVGLSLIGMLNSSVYTVIGFCIFALFNTMVNIQFTTILQIAIPPQLRGRVFGLIMTLAGGFMPIGYVLVGLAAEFIELQYIIIFNAGIVALLGLSLLFQRGFIEFMSLKNLPPPQPMPQQPAE